MNYEYDVSIIIVNFNGIKYIDCLFDSLVELDVDFKFEVIFVDNGSTDSSVEYLEKKKLNKKINLSIVKSDFNLGFAGGNNLGVSKATGEYIVFLNNDTKVNSIWLKELYGEIKNDNTIGIVNSKILFFYDFIKINISTQDNILIDKKILINEEEYELQDKFCRNIVNSNEGVICFGNTELYIPLLKDVCDYEIKFNILRSNCDSDTFLIGESCKEIIRDSKVIIAMSKQEVERLKVALIQNAGSFINDNYDGYDNMSGQIDNPTEIDSQEVEMGCGASIILRKDIFNQVGGFDDRFFMYYEDADLSFRIKKLGKRIILNPKSVLRHIHTGSSKEWSPFFMYHVYRNKLLFLYKNKGKKLYFKFLLRQINHGIKTKNKIELKASIDSVKIIMGRNAVYNT